MRLLQRALLMLMAVCLTNAQGETNNRDPHLGYVYPAGGRQGFVFQVTAGGQYLQGADNVYISGEGVSASVIRYIQPLNKKQLNDVRMKVNQLRREKMGISGGNQPNRKDANRPNAAKQESEDIKLPDNPLLKNLENMSLSELQNLMKELFNPKKQQNMQIAETVIIEVHIAPNAVPGDRELRLETAAGLTNPLCFQVGTLPEIRKPEFNDPSRVAAKPIDLPVVFNSQIMPGEVDSFKFRARQGQHLVMEAQARHLIPYLADAVPGWFQAVLTLCDAEGRELATADDYRFDPDPVLYYEIQKGGEYELRIYDVIYRGREDFVYRVSVSELPFISEIFPLGGQTGVPTVASIVGWNLPKRHIALDTQPDYGDIREASLLQKNRFSNSIPYAVDPLPECNEIEIHNTIQNAQQVTLPVIINGRIERAGDIDIYKFDAHGGDEIVAEVYARRLGSPLDSLLRLTDETGHVLAWNDDHEDKEMGLQTHYADSYLDFRLPKDGTYYVHLSDAQHHGGKEYAYRLRISPPRPDFALYATPSSINMAAGRSAAFCVNIFRKEGFKGDIEVAIKDAPAGFNLVGQQIPGDCNRIYMTLTAPDEPSDDPVVLQLEGSGAIGGKTVSRPVIPAQEMMQAFAYWHLVKSQELMVDVMESKRFAPTFALASDKQVQIPAGGIAEVRIKIWKRPMFPNIQLELSQPPKGITLQSSDVKSDEAVLVIKADGKLLNSGYKNNLIVEASTEIERNRPNNKAAKVKTRVSLGVLPAIPFEVVQQ